MRRKVARKTVSQEPSFQPGRNQKQVVEAAKRIVQEWGNEIVVDIDLPKFFDRIHHDRLIFKLSETIPDKCILRIMGKILLSGVIEGGIVKSTQEGSSQGCPLIEQRCIRRA